MVMYHRAQTWALAEYTGGGAWRPETGLPRPGKIAFSPPIQSTSIKKILIDGGVGRIRSEVTWNPEEIQFVWPDQNTTILKTRLENYIKSGSPLRITTHAGEIFYGRFNRFVPEWVLSGSTQKYALQVILDTYKKEDLENE